MQPLNEIYNGFAYEILKHKNWMTGLILSHQKNKYLRVSFSCFLTFEKCSLQTFPFLEEASVTDSPGGNTFSVGRICTSGRKLDKI